MFGLKIISLVVASVIAGYIFMYSSPFEVPSSTPRPVVTASASPMMNKSDSPSPAVSSPSPVATNEVILPKPTPVMDANNSGCDLNVSASGASFSPNKCEFQIISPGVLCGEPGKRETCISQYSFVIEDKNALVSPDVIERIYLTQFEGFEDGIKNGTLIMDKERNIYNINGNLLKSTGKTRNLNKGSITIKREGNSNLITVDFDLTFDTGITVKGSGNVPIVFLATP